MKVLSQARQWVRYEYQWFKEASQCDKKVQMSKIVKRVGDELSKTGGVIGFYEMLGVTFKVKRLWEEVESQEELSNRVLWRSHERAFHRAERRC